MRRSRRAISVQFGHNLTEARGWAPLSQVELAERAFLWQRDVSKLESGLRCSKFMCADLLYGNRLSSACEA